MNTTAEDVHAPRGSCMLDIMNLSRRFASLLSLPSLLFAGLVALSSGSTSCGSDQACFYFTQVEYDIDNSCPSQEEALAFFKGDTCSTPITDVNSDGRFDGTTCCYDVTEMSGDFFDCGIGPVPVPGTAVTSVGSTGGGGFGGAGGAGGAAGAGGNVDCARCLQFLQDDMPPTLCETSVPIYEAVSDCMCLGACKTACNARCTMQMDTPECNTCITDTMNGCGSQYLMCVDDN